MCCGSKGVGNACCPSPQFFTEEFCGNYSGGEEGIALELWAAAGVSDYVQGTFQIYNATGPGTVDGTANLATLEAPPGTTDSISIANPTNFTLTAPANTSGTYCIRLYKRLIG